MDGYERLARQEDLLRRARELAAKTLIIDVEPLVASWDTSQALLDRGVADMLAQAASLPEVRVVCFATNSARTPSTLPASESVRVLYLASAGKPLRTDRYRDLPEPGVVIGDQVATDGILARRLGYTFLHYLPPLSAMPVGPRVLRSAGRFVLPLVFRQPRRADDEQRGR
jgi:predicted HAD superfamily phosphohydrolase YqeG